MAQSSSGRPAPQACPSEAVQGCSPGSPTGLPCGPGWVPSPRWPRLLWGPLAPRGHPLPLLPLGVVLRGWCLAGGATAGHRLCPPPTPAAPGCGSRKWVGGGPESGGAGAGVWSAQPRGLGALEQTLSGLNSGGAVGAAPCPPRRGQATPSSPWAPTSAARGPAQPPPGPPPSVRRPPHCPGLLRPAERGKSWELRRGDGVVRGF